MKRNGIAKSIVLIVAMLLVASACDSEGEVELTTTSSIVGSTTAPDTESSTTESGDTTTTTLAGERVDDFEIVSRESSDDGETLFIIVPEGSYTDVDLENFIGDLIDNDDAIESVEVFDDNAGYDAFLLDDSDRTADDLVAIDEHHLVSLVDRSRIIFRGPYEEFGEIAIGS